MVSKLFQKIKCLGFTLGYIPTQALPPVDGSHLTQLGLIYAIPWVSRDRKKVQGARIYWCGALFFSSYKYNRDPFEIKVFWYFFRVYLILAEKQYNRPLNERTLMFLLSQKEIEV